MINMLKNHSLSVLFLIIISSCVQTKSIYQNKNMTTIIQEIINKKPNSLSAVEVLLFTKLDKDSELSNPYYTIYEGDKNNAFEKVELRLPNELTEKKECRLIFDILPNTAFTKQKIVEQYEPLTPITFIPPHPNDIDQSNNLSINLSDVMLSFQFKGESTNCNKIIIAYKL